MSLKKPETVTSLNEEEAEQEAEKETKANQKSEAELSESEKEKANQKSEAELSESEKEKANQKSEAELAEAETETELETEYELRNETELDDDDADLDDEDEDAEDEDEIDAEDEDELDAEDEGELEDGDELAEEEAELEAELEAEEDEREEEAEQEPEDALEGIELEEEEKHETESDDDEEEWSDLEADSIIPRKWKGFGSEVDVDQEIVIDSRPLISMRAYRFRQYFGDEFSFEDAPKGSNFTASFPSEPAEDHPSIQTIEVDRGIQVIPGTKDVSTQTGFSFKRNKIVQYSTQSITENNVANIMGSRAMAKFFKRVMPRLDKVLQQNEMVDLLHDDYRNLKSKRGHHEMEFSKDSLLLQEYQTYSDFKHSKGRTVTCMIFHPALEDVVVMATATDSTWEKRIDSHSKVLMDPNYVLFWDLRDSSHPQIMLDAPADVFSFQINPSDPHLICGGCANGQIAFWDLGRTYFELSAKIQDRRSLTDTKTKRPSFLDTLKDSAETLVCPLIPVTALSNLDLSHKRAVTSVAWLPPHVELGKNGMTYDSRSGRSVQFMSVAGDGTLRLWDIRPQKKLPGQAEDDDDEDAKDVIKVNKWAHLENNQWKYHFRFSIEKKDGRPLFATSVRICEMRNTVKEATASNSEDVRTSSSENPGEENSGEENSGEENPSEEIPGEEIRTNRHTKGGILSQNQICEVLDALKEANASNSEDVRTSSNENPGEENPGEESRTTTQTKGGILTQNLTVDSTIFVGSETGQIALVDWLRNAEGEVAPEFGNKILTNVYLHTYHHGAITCIRRSPFFPELYLVVGGGTISIWNRTCTYPIFLSGGLDVFPWCAIWSNSRPAVFYVGNREGSVSIWDLMDSSNGPVITQPVTNVNITDIGLPNIAASASKNQYLAVTDSEGVLMVLLLPRFYARPLPNEEHAITELMNRENSRMDSWEKETESRAEKISTVNYNWQQSRVLKSPDAANREEIEQEYQLNEEYKAFLEYEKEMVEIFKRDEPPLPTMDTQVDEFDALITEAYKNEDSGEEEEEEEEEPFDFDDYRDFDDDDDDDNAT